MSDRDIHIHLRISSRHLRAGAALLVLAVCAVELSSESLTLSTTYPSPAGIYKKIVTTAETQLARDGGSVGLGVSSLNSAVDGKLKIDASSLGSWTTNGWKKGLRLEGISALELGGGASTKYGIGASGGNLYFFDTATEGASGSAASYRMVFAGGRVGIGTASPGSALSVSGSADFSGTVTAANVVGATYAP